MNYLSLLKKQKAFFNTNQTHDLDFRKKNLKKLKILLKEYENDFSEALLKDLHKSYEQSFVFEFSGVNKEINLFRKNLNTWSKNKFKGFNLATFPAFGFTKSSPYGVSLIISPWNYPYLLTLKPLVGAIGAGNCSIIKPSELCPNFSSTLEKVINDNFPEEYLKVINGGVETSTALLAEDFDFIFFTGSPRVGKIIASAASKHLTPFVVELGGKSPCFVDKTADISLTAKRIAWGKFTNAGQTCVAPDFLVVDQEIKEELIKEINKYLEIFYGSDAKESEDYGRMISQNHTLRLVEMLKKDGEKNIDYNIEEKYLAPVIINSSEQSEVMKEEIFGPVLPILSYKDIRDSFPFVKSLDPPLALYIYSKQKKLQEEITSTFRFGGGCINDSLAHLSHSKLPFGGMKTSGIGNYHGKYSFEAFSHKKGILKNFFFLDIFLRYPPLKSKIKWLKMILGD